MAIVLVPIIGVRNIFFLEWSFRFALFATLALGLNIVVGFAGLLDLGYIAFYAVGAYLWAFFGSQQIVGTSTRSRAQPPPTSGFPFTPTCSGSFFLSGMGLAALMGIALGTPVLRLRGDYLAIVTLGFGEVIRVLANNLGKPINLTNGPQGHHPHPAPRPAPRADRPMQFRGWLTAMAGTVIGLGDILQLLLLSAGAGNLGRHHRHRASPGGFQARSRLDRHPRR